MGAVGPTTYLYTLLCLAVAASWAGIRMHADIVDAPKPNLKLSRTQFQPSQDFYESEQLIHVLFDEHTGRRRTKCAKYLLPCHKRTAKRGICGYKESERPACAGSPSRQAINRSTSNVHIQIASRPAMPDVTNTPCPCSPCEIPEPSSAPFGAYPILYMSQTQIALQTKSIRTLYSHNPLPPTYVLPIKRQYAAVFP